MSKAQTSDHQCKSYISFYLRIEYNLISDKYGLSSKQKKMI